MSDLNSHEKYSTLNPVGRAFIDRYLFLARDSGDNNKSFSITIAH